MCGIAGIVALDPQERIDSDQVREMVRTIRHRGPDHQAFRDWQHASLGMARLSIIDLAGGDQPIANEDETVWVIQNGEIYNFLELRAELEEAGHRFRTRSDTECLVHGYEQWGDGILERLRGMYAFAIWDDRRQRMLIARDRLGEKPLYYLQGPRRFVFASELKALRHAGFEREIDSEALDEYLSFGYIAAPRTIYRGVRKLPPASAIIIDRTGVVTKRYWAPPLAHRTVSFGEAKEQVTSILEDAVRTQMISDAPLGAFLSGGLDSSTIVALMARTSTARIRTFCVGFEEAEYDERTHARRVADHLGTDHEEMVLRPNVAEILPRLVGFFDEPFGDKSMVPTYFVAQMTRKHVKVALSGDGGDEVFGGYVSYTSALARAERGARRAPWVNRLIKAGARAYPDMLPGAFRIQKRSFDERTRFIASSFVFDLDAKRALYADGLRAGLRQHDPFAPKRDLLADARDLDFLSALQYSDLLHYLPDDILAKVDRMTMMNSLESRAPLLDHRLVECVLALPARYKIERGVTKRLLRAIAGDLLPADILARPKRGFALPVRSWLSRDLHEMTSDVVLGARLRSTGWFKRAELERRVDEARRPAAGADQRLWLLLCLGLWLEGQR